jgi:hypothetical protein
VDIVAPLKGKINKVIKGRVVKLILVIVVVVQRSCQQAFIHHSSSLLFATSILTHRQSIETPEYLDEACLYTLASVNTTFQLCQDVRQ